LLISLVIDLWVGQIVEGVLEQFRVNSEIAAKELEIICGRVLVVEIEQFGELVECNPLFCLWSERAVLQKLLLHLRSELLQLNNLLKYLLSLFLGHVKDRVFWVFWKLVYDSGEDVKHEIVGLVFVYPSSSFALQL